jgi:hypothetical protein
MGVLREFLEVFFNEFFLYLIFKFRADFNGKLPSIPFD